MICFGPRKGRMASSSKESAQRWCASFTLFLTLLENPFVIYFWNRLSAEQKRANRMTQIINSAVANIIHGRHTHVHRELCTMARWQLLECAPLSCSRVIAIIKFCPFNTCIYIFFIFFLSKAAASKTRPISVIQNAIHLRFRDYAVLRHAKPPDSLLIFVDISAMNCVAKCMFSRDT